MREEYADKKLSELLRKDEEEDASTLKVLRQAQNDIKQIRQNFYSQFYLLNGLSKLRTCINYNTREDLFKNLTETSSSNAAADNSIEAIITETDGFRQETDNNNQFESRAV